MTTAKPEPWPGVRFGNLDASDVDWRAARAVTDADPDDEELADTPPDVVAMLGFDPKEDATAKLAKRKGGKSLGPIEFDRKATLDAQANLHALWRSIFQRQTRAARRAILSTKKLAKQDGEDDEPDESDIDDAVASIDLGLTKGQTEELTSTLEDVAADSGEMALAQVGLGDRAGMFEHMSVRARDWAKNHAADLVANIEETTRDQVKQAIVDGYEENLSVAEIADKIEEVGAFSEDRAALIAETEVRFANSYGALDGYKEARDGGVELMKEWLAGPGACDDCQDNEDEGPIPLDDDFPSGDPATPAHPNCLPGDTRISAEGVTAATKRWYDGDLVVIRTSSGKKFRCTPNHPILAASGWVAAGLLKEGDDVVSSGGVEWRSRSLDLDTDDVPACIEDVAEAFGRSEQVAAVPVPVAAKHFHGDGEGSEVAIVWADRLLMRSADAALGKQSSEFALGFADMQASRHDSAGTPDLLVRALLATANCFMSGGGAGTTLVGGHRGHADAVGFGLTSDLDVGLAQKTGDDVAIDASFTGNLQKAHASEVFFDAIVSARRVRFSGHVYNLQTASGFYIADGIIAHNCRCAISPVVFTAEGVESEGEEGED